MKEIKKKQSTQKKKAIITQKPTTSLSYENENENDVLIPTKKTKTQDEGAKKKRRTFTEELAELTNPASKDFDPENENEFENIHYSEDDVSDTDFGMGNGGLNMGTSKLRQIDISVTSGKYAGKKGRREDIESWGLSEKKHSESEGEDLDEKYQFSDKRQEDIYENGEQADYNEEENHNDEGGISMLNQNPEEDEIEKAKHTKNQISLWNSFLEVRIQMQRAILSANKFPRPPRRKRGGLVTLNDEDQQKQQDKSEINSYLLFKQSNPKIEQNFSDITESLRSLLGDFLELNEILIEQNPDIFTIRNKEKKKRTREKMSKNGGEDEDEDEDEDEGKNLQALWETISGQYKDILPFMKDTVDKWDRRVNLFSGKAIDSSKFKSLNKNPFDQTDNLIETDVGVVYRKAQVKRSNYKVFGQTEEESNNAVEELPEEIRNEDSNEVDIPALLKLRGINQSAIKAYDYEAFDDTEFYQVLLRELIDSHTSNSAPSIKHGERQKKTIDRKAINDRKIKYDVIPELQNFMSPVALPIPSFDTEDLFSNLFGLKRDTE